MKLVTILVNGKREKREKREKWSLHGRHERHLFVLIVNYEAPAAVVSSEWPPH